MDQHEQQIEIARLATILQHIEKQIRMSEEHSDHYRNILQTSLKDYWKSGRGNATDEAQQVETLTRQRALFSHTHSATRQLQKMLTAPYFGRIDFAETGYPAEAIYIGIGSLADKKTGEFLIYDWRAPVSSMFYDYGRGQASYMCPEGEITGSITLKRQYKIAKGHIEYMFDSDLKIDDEILQQLLSKSADDKMHTIVNSIQREQNQIIRDTNHKVLLVEGPAGSGKTSAALHRVAFLLYHDRDRLTSQNVLILSPNNIFGDYISNVLPEIGEENVVQMTFQDYVARSAAGVYLQFESRTVYLEHMLAANFGKKRAANIRFKSSSAFALALLRYLSWISSERVENYPAIMLRGETIFSQQEWRHYYTDSFAMMPPALRLEKIKTIIQDRMHKFVLAVREEKVKEITNTGEEVNAKVIKILARMQARDELRPITEQIGQLTTLDATAEYKNLFSDDRLFHITGLAVPSDWEMIKKQTRAAINRGMLHYEDIAPFLYFQGVLQGFPASPDIKHVVIDEAQDYTVFQYKILAQLFPNCSWTIVGDPAQVVQPFLTTASFAEAGNIINMDQTLLVRLTKSYRSTREIQAFCQAILPGTEKALSVNRPGPLPVVIQTDQQQGMVSAIISTVQAMKDQGWRSIGLITKNAAQAMAIYQSLQNSISPTLVTREEDTFHQGVIVIPSYLAKGLEFDAVLVLNADANNYCQEQDRHILYTICTRALHRLYLYYQQTLSPFITPISKASYQLVVERK